MADETTIAVEIGADPSAVFAFISEPRERVQWVDELVETVELSPPPLGPGSTFTLRIREGGRIVDYAAEVLALERDRRYAVRMTRGSMVITVDHLLEPTAAGTRVEARVTTTSTSRLVRLAGSLAVGMTRGIIERQLQRLKTVAESSR
jgi:carbon monoxide dehydrogenase subunit G